MERAALRPASAPRARVLALLARLGAWRSNRLLVPAYADVSDAAAFERHLGHFAERHPVVSVGRVLDTFEGGRALPPRSVLLTFHEPASFAAVGWPLLRRHGFAAVLFVAPDARGPGGASWDELELLARQGVALGLRGDAFASAAPSAPQRVVTELARALGELERLQPGQARLCALPAGRPEEALVEAVRGAGVELAFTGLSGTNHLARVDRLRLRSVALEAGVELDELRARRLGALAEPTTPEERRHARTRRVQRVRLRYLHRPLDAVLTAGLEPRARLGSALRGLTRRRSSHYERFRSLVQLVTAPFPPLARRLRRGLLDTAQLALACACREPIGHGTAATVFALASAPGARAHVLKVYRWTLGLPSSELARLARRHRERYRRIRGWFGAHVLPTHFLVLNGPLRALPVAACLQERVLPGRDLLALPDAELLQLLRSDDALRDEFTGFARRLLAVRAEGFFPDLVGAGNLLFVAGRPGTRLCLIDYGLFDLRGGTTHVPAAAIQATARRFEALLSGLEAGLSRQPS